MLRFIFEHVEKQEGHDRGFEHLFTRTFDVPEIERILTDGGYSSCSYERNKLVGIEVIDEVTDI